MRVVEKKVAEPDPDAVVDPYANEDPADRAKRWVSQPIIVHIEQHFAYKALHTSDTLHDSIISLTRKLFEYV